MTIPATPAVYAMEKMAYKRGYEAFKKRFKRNDNPYKGDNRGVLVIAGCAAWYRGFDDAKAKG